MSLITTMAVVFLACFIVGAVILFAYLRHHFNATEEVDVTHIVYSPDGQPLTRTSRELKAARRDTSKESAFEAAKQMLSSWRVLALFVAVGVISFLLTEAFIFFLDLFGFQAFVPGLTLTALAIPSAMVAAALVSVWEGNRLWMSFFMSWAATNVGLSLAWFLEEFFTDPWGRWMVIGAFVSPLLALVLGVVAAAAAALVKVNHQPA